LKSELEKTFPNIEVELVKSSGGAFEVTKDGEIVFSKKKTGRFPDSHEVISAIKQ
jgi:selenoprotein W-related protein